MNHEQSPTLDEWRHLYDAHAAMKALTPWEFMEEDDIFAVQNPETGEIGFVSAMGSAGEHYSIGVYLGAEALYRSWNMHAMGPKLRPEYLLETPQLQASFENREMIEKEDRAVIKMLGRKYRGRHAWPLFRSYRPGYVPWFLNGAEARFLTHILEQTEDVARRFQENPALLEPTDDISYLVRVAQEENGRFAWRDEQKQFPPPEGQAIEFTVNRCLLTEFAALKQQRGRLEVDLFLMPTPVGDRGERPYFPYLLLLVEPQAMFIVGSEMLQPFPTLEEMYSESVNVLLARLVDSGFRPHQLAIGSPELASRLEVIAPDLQLKVIFDLSLSALESVKEDLLAFLSR